MNLRRLTNGTPVLAGGVVIAAAAAALFFHYRGDFWPRATTARYFTTDDGQTFFAGTQYDYAPFMKDGKEAVRAYVYECEGKAFVGYLERYNKQSRPAMEELAQATKEKRPPNNVGALIAANRSGTEVKRPGDAEWISGAPGPGSSWIRLVKCQDGTSADPKNLK